jgi:hypothetical protein
LNQQRMRTPQAPRRCVKKSSREHESHRVAITNAFFLNGGTCSIRALTPAQMGQKSDHGRYVYDDSWLVKWGQNRKEGWEGQTQKCTATLTRASAAAA